jgi:hypothetical protein
MANHRAGHCSSQSDLLSPPQLDQSRLNPDQRHRLEDTPSRGKFVKEPLSFSLIEPAVLCTFWNLRFLLLKTYFWLSLIKIWFNYL